MPSCLSEFACSVDQLLLEKLKYPFLKEFKVAFFLNYPSIASNIDRWIHAVAAKQVEKLDLDFLDVIRPPWSYNFSWPEGCRCLKVLRLSFISVSGEMLEGILAGCPLLQELSVSRSRVLAGFRVLHHEALKHLEIRDCIGSAEKVLITVVSAPNLVYFKFGGNGRFAHISLVNVPCLTQVFLGPSYATHVLDEESSPDMEFDLLHQVLHDSIARRLKELTLDFSDNIWWGSCFRKQERLEMLLDNLTHLNLIVPVCSAFSFRLYDISELKKTASPAFHNFVPKLGWMGRRHRKILFTNRDVGMREEVAKKWTFNNKNGGLFTITWRGDQGRHGNANK
ncbi:unnamed protein product [Cuscuta campestris]|uniref:F-box/LRR-repeat protein 15/At3g58940/PEG3-like LRR domain-containing protein n=1 Tax=Cuscuta campestris TaxID=132261 RepID=A0A484KMJ8_9ASTE|nr:unnamed protein product [Cuscuta campestris]